MRHGRRTIRLLIVAILTWLAAGMSSHAQNDPGGSNKKSFLWKVQGRVNSVYLAGSMHVLTPEYYPLSERIERAFKSAGTLVEEVHLDELTSDETKLAIIGKAMYQDGRTLDAVLSKDTYHMVASRVKDAGVPMDAFNRMKPWMVALTLLSVEIQKAGFDASLGIDRYFFDKAQTAGKEIRGLETTMYQIDRFDQMSAALQEQMLRETLADFDVQRRNMRVLADAWAAGDSATIERLLLAGFKDSPGAYERLLVERNRNWLPKIEACFQQPSPCFVVVGAAHLVGPDGLVALFRQRGYGVEQQ